MVIYAMDENGEEIFLAEPLEFDYRANEGAPACSLKAVFSASEEWQRFVSAKAFLKGKLVFDGIVDEQTELSDASGITVTLCMRGRAALLLDNEIPPQTMVNPSAGLIERKLLEPFGLSLSGDRLTRNGRLEIKKGESAYTALKKYAEDIVGERLYISPLSEISIGKRGCERYSLSGIISYKKAFDNYSPISSLLIRDSASGLYSSLRKNFLVKGITRQRCVDSVDSLSFGDGISYELIFSSEEWLSHGDSLIISELPEDMFSVSGIHISGSASGIRTVISAVKCEETERSFINVVS